MQLCINLHKYLLTINNLKIKWPCWVDSPVGHKSLLGNLNLDNPQSDDHRHQGGGKEEQESHDGFSQRFSHVVEVHYGLACLHGQSHSKQWWDRAETLEEDQASKKVRAYIVEVEESKKIKVLDLVKKGEEDFEKW